MIGKNSINYADFAGYDKQSHQQWSSLCSLEPEGHPKPYTEAELSCSGG
jgi:hypothetical protein